MEELGLEWDLSLTTEQELLLFWLFYKMHPESKQKFGKLI